MFGDFMKGRKDNLYTTIFTIIGIVLGWAIGKINTMIPKLLLIIAKDTEQLCGKTDVDDGNNDKRLSKDGIKM